MAARKKVEEEPASPGPGLIVGTWRLINTLLMIAILLYIAALVALRTEGLKGVIRERLEDQLGLEVTIEKMRGDAAFNLTLTGVSGKTTNESSRAGFEVGTVRIDWDVAGTVQERSVRIDTLTCDGGAMVLERAGGEWNPENLAGIGDWLAEWFQLPIAPDTNVTPSAMAADSAWAATSLVTSNIDIFWVLSATNNAGEIRSLALQSRPLATQRRYLRHYTLSAVYAEAGGVQVRNAEIEWIDAHDTNVVLGRIEERVGVVR